MSEPFLADWVRETSTVEGTGDISLLGAVANFRTFASLYSTGQTFYYTAKHRTALEAESGIGQLTASGTIARTNVLESTNGNAAVAFSAGTKDVFIAPVSRMFPSLADNEIWQGVTGNTPITTNSPYFEALTINTGPTLLTGSTISNGQINATPNVPTVIPLLVRGTTGQTAVLIDCRDVSGTSLFSVQPGGEIRGNAATGNIKLQDGISGVTIFDAFIISTGAWVDAVTGTTRVRWGNTTPAAANNVIFCAAGGALLNRFAISSTSVQVSGRLATLIPAPLTNTTFEVIGTGATNIGIAIRAAASQSGNLLNTYDSANVLMSSIGPTGKFLAPDGTQALPGISFLQDTDTGIWPSTSGGDRFSLVGGGSVMMAIGKGTGCTIFNNVATSACLVVRGFTGQTGDYFQLQNNLSAALVKVTATASVVLAGAALTTVANDGFTYLPSCPGKPAGVPTAQTGTVPIVVDSTNSQTFIYSGSEWVCVGPTTDVFVLRGTPSAPGAPEGVGVNKGAEIVMPYAGKFLRARARAKTGPTGADLIFDINLNGTTIWSTQANRLKIVAGATSGSQTTFNTTTFVDGDVMTIDVDQIGSTVAGQDITVQVEVRKTG